MMGRAAWVEFVPRSAANHLSMEMNADLETEVPAETRRRNRDYLMR